MSGHRRIAGDQGSSFTHDLNSAADAIIATLPLSYKIFYPFSATIGIGTNDVPAHPETLVPWLERVLLRRMRSILIQSLHPLLQLRPEVSRQINSLTSLSSLFFLDSSIGVTADIAFKARQMACESATWKFAQSQQDGTVDVASMHSAARYFGRNMLFIGLAKVEDWMHIASSANNAVDASLAITGPFEASGWKDAEGFRSKCSRCVVLIGESAAIPLEGVNNDRFIVSGAGSPELNGEYLLDGEKNGRDTYWKVGSREQAHFDGSNWVLKASESTAYYANSDVDEPPLSGWSVLHGVEPAPSLKRQTSVAREGQSSLGPGNSTLCHF